MKYEDFVAVMKCAEKHYSANKLEHAAMVMKYVQDDPRWVMMTDEEKNFVMALAIAHDVIEDTKCSWSELQSGITDEDVSRKFYIALDLLTHSHEDTYGDYIDRIIRSKNIFAIMVKQADMKDHLMRKETLSKKKREKYEPVLPRLLRA